MDENDNNGTTGLAADDQRPITENEPEALTKVTPAQAATPEAPDTRDGIIEKWFAESFHGTALAAQTQLYNLVHNAKEDLKKRLAAIAIALLFLLGGAHMASAQQTGVLMPGSGANFLAYLPLPAGTFPLGQGVTSNPVAGIMSGDGTMNAAGVITITKTNGTLFGTAALANIGTSGSTVPQLNASNTWASGTLQSFAGHVVSGGASPVLTSCGTSPTIAGDDKNGLITMGTGSPTGCVATFATAYTGTPLCTVSWQATPLVSQSYVITNTTITLTQTGTSSNKVNYHCAAPIGG